MKSIAVIIADLHFNLANLEVASDALVQAFREADANEVPLIIAGDLLDGKAIIRAEVMNRLITIFSDRPPNRERLTWILVGNHDLCNEKGKENALRFLAPYAQIVSSPVKFNNLIMMPYFNDARVFLNELERFSGKGHFVIAHQGVKTAFMGAYAQDKSSLPPEFFKNYRVISGHYHCRQDIVCGPRREGMLGLFSYVGSPFTVNFAEAGDGTKGFCVLMEDGSLDQIVLSLRRHHVVERSAADSARPLACVFKEDFLWLKITGTRAELAAIDKHTLGLELLGHNNYKLDKIEIKAEEPTVSAVPLTDAEVFDTMIEELADTVEQKNKLKSIWREVLDETT